MIQKKLAIMINITKQQVLLVIPIEDIRIFWYFYLLVLYYQEVY
jgi:hypothetical protein